jgi:hypothetical protein
LSAVGRALAGKDLSGDPGITGCGLTQSGNNRQQIAHISMRARRAMLFRACLREGKYIGARLIKEFNGRLMIS